MGATASHLSGQLSSDSYGASVDVAGHLLWARAQREAEVVREVWKIDSVVAQLDVRTLYASASHQCNMLARTEAQSFLSPIGYDALIDDDDGSDGTNRRARRCRQPMEPSLKSKPRRKRGDRLHRARMKGGSRQASCEHSVAIDCEMLPQTRRPAPRADAAEAKAVDIVLPYDVRRAARTPPCTLESVLFPSCSTAESDALSGFLDRVRERTKAVQAHIHLRVPCPLRFEYRTVMQQHLSWELARHLRVPEHRVPAAHEDQS